MDITDFIFSQREDVLLVGDYNAYRAHATRKLHKLRILLRNETVAWVDSFISGDGMDEVIQLLYRIMKVEWRYAY